MSVADVIEHMTDGEVPVRLTAWDGSSTGDGPVHLHLATERALARMITAHGDLGLARAYLSGDLQVEGVHPGNPYEAMRMLQRWQLHRPDPREVVRTIRSLGLARLLPPAPPVIEAPPRWRRALVHHTRVSDAETVRYHYDVSNGFYEMILGPTMAYSCAVFSTPQTSLAEAQTAKYELICRKLGLREGMRLLDIGCGWGGLVRHATRHHGVEATGVTLSPEQAQWARAAAQAEGLGDRVHILEADYRDAPGGPYDAIASVGMIEHVGVHRYPGYFRVLHDLLVPGGRLLNHGITRANSHSSAHPGAFIDRYVFPDGELPSPGRVILAAHDAGFELRHTETLREHYALTLKAWCENLVERWDDAVAAVGIERAKVWGLYMAGSRVSFEEGSLQVHQVLAVRPTEDGESGMTLRPDWV